MNRPQADSLRTIELYSEESPASVREERKKRLLSAHCNGDYDEQNS